MCAFVICTTHTASKHMKGFYLDGPYNVLSAFVGYREWVWIAAKDLGVDIEELF